MAVKIDSNTISIPERSNLRQLDMRKADENNKEVLLELESLKNVSTTSLNEISQEIGNIISAQNQLVKWITQHFNQFDFIGLI